MRRIFKCLAILAMFSGPLHAEDVPVESRIYLEQSSGDIRIVEEAGQLRRGDRIVTVLDWRASEYGSTITSAVPAHLSFLDASAEGVEVSNDGGRNWRALSEANGAKVTHLRWRTTPGRGRLAYSAIVR